MSRRWLLLTAAAVAALSWPASSQAQTNQDPETKGKQNADQAQTEVVPLVYSNPFAYFNPFVVPWPYVVPAASLASGASRTVFSSYPPAPAGNALPRTTRIYTYSTRPTYGPGYPYPGSGYVQRQRIDDFDTGTGTSTTIARQSNYPLPENPTATGPAHLDVRLPAEAELWVDGKKTSQSGENRKFTTPDLKPGQEYVYEMRAQWNGKDGKKEEIRRIAFRAGEQVKVDFTKPGPDGEMLEMPKTK
jgi:uncharacterized protein (TIGR03000 family)